MVGRHSLAAEHWCSGIFPHFGTRLLARILQAALRIVHYQLLAKGIDEALSAAGDDEFIGPDAGEAHRIAYHIPPQTAGCGDYHGVVLAYLHAAERHHKALVFQLSAVVNGLHGRKLIIDAIVEHQHHGGVGGVVLYSEETLGGVIGLHVVHVGLRYQLLVGFTIRREGDASVEEYLQIGPHFLQMLLAAELHYPCQHRHHPRWHAAEVGDIGVQALARYLLALLLKVTDEGRLLVGHTYQVYQRVDVLYQYGRQITHE